jgi:hypothetical protein
LLFAVCLRELWPANAGAAGISLLHVARAAAVATIRGKRCCCCLIAHVKGSAFVESAAPAGSCGSATTSALFLQGFKGFVSSQQELAGATPLHC